MADTAFAQIAVPRKSSEDIKTVGQQLNETNALLNWYRSHARPVLDELASDRVEDFEGHVTRLTRLARLADQEIAACFLGQAAVGKSTLINALVAGGEVVLPAGGVGPLTAQAIELRYSDKPMFTVEYHRMQQFWQLVFALEQKLLRVNSKNIMSDLTQEFADEEDPIIADDAQVAEPHFGKDRFTAWKCHELASAVRLMQGASYPSPPPSEIASW